MSGNLLPTGSCFYYATRVKPGRVASILILSRMKVAGIFFWKESLKGSGGDFRLAVGHKWLIEKKSSRNL